MRKSYSPAAPVHRSDEWRLARLSYVVPDPGPHRQDKAQLPFDKPRWNAGPDIVSLYHDMMSHSHRNGYLLQIRPIFIAGEPFDSNLIVLQKS